MNKPLAEGAGLRRSGSHILDGISLEITAKDADALRGVANDIAPGTSISIAFLPGETVDDRVMAATIVRQLGFNPMPHLAARRFRNIDELQSYIAELSAQAGVKQCFIVAGDPADPAGPYPDSMTMIRSGLFERAKMDTVGIGGHPEGSPHMTPHQCLEILEAKCAEIARREMKPLIVTQFAFDADLFIDWLDAVRARGIHAPVRLGIPGPAGIKTLIRFSARCGVGASASVLAKYGVSLTRLIGTTGPDRLVEELSTRLTPAHGPVSLHLYSFGGVERAAEWMIANRLRTDD